MPLFASAGTSSLSACSFDSSLFMSNSSLPDSFVFGTKQSGRVSLFVHNFAWESCAGAVFPNASFGRATLLVSASESDPARTRQAQTHDPHIICGRRTGCKGGNFPNEPDFVQELPSILSHFVRCMKCLLPTSLVETCFSCTLVARCNGRSFVQNQPAGDDANAICCPCRNQGRQSCHHAAQRNHCQLSKQTRFHPDIVMKLPLLSDPAPPRLVLLVLLHHSAMAIPSFKCKDCFELQMPSLFQFLHDVRPSLCCSQLLATRCLVPFFGFRSPSPRWNEEQQTGQGSAEQGTKQEQT